LWTRYLECVRDVVDVADRVGAAAPHGVVLASIIASNDGSVGGRQRLALRSLEPWFRLRATADASVRSAWLLEPGQLGRAGSGPVGWPDPDASEVRLSAGGKDGSA
jgi:hypothetical protein